VHYHHHHQQQQLHSLGLIFLFSLHLKHFFQKRSWGWGPMGRAPQGVEPRGENVGSKIHILNKVRLDALDMF
jgi:hypothetical protein